jgi:hypothetical protein
MFRSSLVALAATALLVTGCTVSTSTSTGSLSVEDLKFSSTKDGSQVRSDATFKPGEVVYILFKVKGFKNDDQGKAHVQEDLIVKGPDGKEVLNQKNLLDFNDKGGDTLNLDNNLNVPPTFPTGTYSVTIALRDVNGGGTYNHNGSFKLEGAPVGGAAPPAGEETPAAAETPAMEETPATEETPAAEETPASEETPST